MSPTYDYNKLANKHILIFGATSGLGFAVAKAALAASARITISSSSAERISSTSQRLLSEFPDAGAKISGYACNLAAKDAEQEIEALFEKVGKVDHIVYTAADALPLMPLQEVTQDKIVAAGHMRFVAPILVAKIGARYLSSGPESSFTLTSGTVWERPMPNWTLVAGYAGGVCSLMRNLALEMKPVRVNVVSPGLVDTEMWDASFENDEKENLFTALAEKHLTGRVATAEEVAEAYIYLMKDTNATGRVISTDSGAGLV